jgi:hypothetical protein
MATRSTCPACRTTSPPSVDFHRDRHAAVNSGLDVLTYT